MYYYLLFLRLGLDTPGLLGLSHNSVEYVLVPTRIKSIKSRIMEIAMGPNHTVLLTDQGKVITMGQNNDAQLGRGHSRSYSRSWPEIVKTMGDKEVTLIAAGASFTVVGKLIINFIAHIFDRRKIILGVIGLTLGTRTP